MTPITVVPRVLRRVLRKSWQYTENMNSSNLMKTSSNIISHAVRNAGQIHIIVLQIRICEWNNLSDLLFCYMTNADCHVPGSWRYIVHMTNSSDQLIRARQSYYRSWQISSTNLSDKLYHNGFSKCGKGRCGHLHCLHDCGCRLRTWVVETFKMWVIILCVWYAFCIWETRDCFDLPVDRECYLIVTLKSFQRELWENGYQWAAVNKHWLHVLIG